jgi:hypothetical protein
MQSGEEGEPWRRHSALLGIPEEPLRIYPDGTANQDKLKLELQQGREPGQHGVNGFGHSAGRYKSRSFNADAE